MQKPTTTAKTTLQTEPHQGPHPTKDLVHDKFPCNYPRQRCSISTYFQLLVVHMFCKDLQSTQSEARSTPEQSRRKYHEVLRSAAEGVLWMARMFLKLSTGVPSTKIIFRQKKYYVVCNAAVTVGFQSRVWGWCSVLLPGPRARHPGTLKPWNLLLGCEAGLIGSTEKGCGLLLSIQAGAICAQATPATSCLIEKVSHR